MGNVSRVLESVNLYPLDVTSRWIIDGSGHTGNCQSKRYDS